MSRIRYKKNVEPMARIVLDPNEPSFLTAAYQTTKLPKLSLAIVVVRHCVLFSVVTHCLPMAHSSRVWLKPQTPSVTF